MSKQKKHLVYEAITWILIIVFSIATVLFFPWYIEESIIKGIFGFAVFALVVWYLKSRQLYFDFQDKYDQLVEKQGKINHLYRTIDLLYKNSADGILEINEEQRIEMFSPGLEKMTGFEAKEVVGRLANSVLKFKAYKGENLLPDLMLAAKDKNKTCLNYLITNSGKEILIEASLTSLKIDGELKGLATIRVA